MTDVGLILRSADGREWTVVGEPHLSPSDALTTVGDLLVSYSAEGKTELSRDGISWLQGPAAPQIDPDSLQIAIGGETGLTVIGWDGLFQSRAWFIPRRAFDDALNGAVPVESAPMPEVGVPYPLQLSVPCSADSLHVVIGGRMFGATFDDVANSNLGRFRDDGSVVLSDATHAMYTTSTGDLVPLTAQHPATDPASCF
jgi:hypothetical protein